MNARTLATVAVWTAGAATAGAVAWKLNPPLPSSAETMAVAQPLPGLAIDEPILDVVPDAGEQGVLWLPTVTIIGPRRGVAEMQGGRPDDLVSGPDTVTRADE